MNAVFWFLVGFLFAVFYERITARTGKEKFPRTEGLEAILPSDENGREYGGAPDPMSLRNGFGVTKAKDPTFAEQWVNILNYDGRNQKEEDYGGEEDYSAENMG